MKTKYIIPSTFKFLFGIFVFLSSCTEDFNPELDSTYTRLVVDGSITTDTTIHRITLLRSGDALNKLPRRGVSEAIVTLSDGTNVFTLAENEANPGVYETQPNTFGVPGKTYVLNIANVDIDEDGTYENYSASSYLPKINPIDSIRIHYLNYSARQKGWFINMFSRDIGGKSFYCVKAYINNKLVTDSLKEYGIANNIGFEGQYYPGISVYYLNNDKVDERVSANDTITLELSGITEEYYNFLNASIAESRPKDPLFSGPSANVPTNIFPKDKAAGFFKAYSVMKKSTIYRGN